MLKVIFKFGSVAALVLAAGVAPAQGIESVARVTTTPTELGRLNSVLGDQKIAAVKAVEMTSGTYAIFHTSEGDFVAALAPEVAPQTVTNFIGYATGKQTWRHPVTMTVQQQPLFSNRTIYRIVPNGMIYSGDPLDRGGEADSGTQLPLETDPTVQFTQPGLLAMDSSGDHMSGSRWFITLRAYPDRNGKYTIFGRVIGGLDLVQRITNKPVQRPQMPLDPVIVQWIEIVKIPAGRIAEGTFVDDDGQPRFRIDPNFKDAPAGTELPSVFTRNYLPGADADNGAANENTAPDDAATTAAETPEPTGSR